MPEIQYVYHLDPEIEAVRSEVASKNDDIPFLLLPVRIETRFMKVPTAPASATQTKNMEALSFDLTDTSLLLSQNLEKATETEKKALFNSVLSKATKSEKTLRQIKDITAQQKTWLGKYHQDIENVFLTQQKFYKNPELHSKISEKLHQLKGRIDNRTIKKQDAYSPGTQLANQLKKIRKRTTQVLQHKIPFSRPKHKKRLYQFIDRLFKDVEQFYIQSLTKVDNVHSIKKVQLKRIQALHQDIKSQLTSVPDKIQSLHSDTNWKKFVHQKRAFINTLDSLFERFEKEMIPKLQYQSSRVTKNADELFQNSLELYKELKTLERTPLNDKTAGDQARKKIRGKLKKLIREKKKMINSSAQQFNNLRRIWQELDKSLGVFKSRLNDLKNSTPGQPQTGEPPKLRTKSKTLGQTKVKQDSSYSVALKNNSKNQEFDFYKGANQDINKLGVVSDTKKINAGLLKESIQEVEKKLVLGIKNKVVLSKGVQTDLLSQLKTIRTNIAQSSLKNKQKNTFNKSVLSLEYNLNNNFGKEEEILVENFKFSDPQLKLNASSDLADELWVRIFPDDLLVQTHEKALTEQEATAGKKYWTAVWAGKHDKTITLDAWRLICSHYGSKRAAWIVKSLDPALVSAANKANFASQTPAYPYTSINNNLVALEVNLAKISKFDPSTLNAEKLFIKYASLAYRSIVRNKFNLINNGLNQYTDQKQPAFLLQETANLMRSIQGHLQVLSKSGYGVQKRFNTGNYVGKTNTQVKTALSRSQFILNQYEKIYGKIATISPFSDTELQAQSNLPFSFPTVTLKADNWSEAPHTNVLPDRFVVVTKTGNTYRHIVVGNPIPEKLQLGMNPASFHLDETDSPYQVDAQGNLSLEPGIHWMVNYEEAVNQGMAISLPLSEYEASNGFDQVFVIGIKNKTAVESKVLLEELLENHHYSVDGMSFLEIGTATNNTDQVKAGFSSNDTDADEAFEQEMSTPMFDATEQDIYKKSDGQRTAEALGIDPGIFQHISNSNNTEISEGFAMHHALWHGTLGDAMEEMWDTVFTYDNIERTKAFFNNHVIGRGLLPSIRIGTLPYGILPTTAYSWFKPNNTYDQNNLPSLENIDTNSAQGKTRLQIRFDIRLHQLLMEMRSIWTQLRTEEVNHAYNVEQSENPREHFVNMLGLTATSEEMHFRYGLLNSYRGSDGERFVGDFQRSFEKDIHLKDRLSDYLLNGHFYDSFPLTYYGQSEESVAQQLNNSRQEYCQYLNQSSVITGEVVDSQLLSREHVLEESEDQNYIDYLLSNNLYEIFNDNNAAEFPSQSVLYFLLRQSLLLSYREAALGILQHENLLTEGYRRIVGGVHDYRARGGGLYRSKWSYLLLTLNEDNFSSYYLDGSQYPTNSFYTSERSRGRSMASYLYNGPRLNSHQNFTKSIDQSRDALAVLARLSNQQLNHLLREHLDVCSYRLDAWMTALANKRLAETRNSQPNGIYLGAYAWVEDLRPGGERALASNVPDRLQDSDAVYTDEDNQGFIHAPSINHAAAAAVLRSAYLANDQQEDLNNQMALNLSSLRIRKAMQLIDGIQNGMELGAILGFQFEKGLHERYNEAELDKFILPFRKAFPLTVPINNSANSPDNTLHTQVVNGLDLLDKVNEAVQQLDFSSSMSLYELLTQGNFKYCPGWLRNLVIENKGSNLELQAVIKELDRIADAFDALGDLAISESVYQIVQGNHVRAAAVLQALGDGKAPPSPLILNTPRTGTVLTHKVMLHVQPHSSYPALWESPLSPRAAAEPSLNNWLAGMIGDPESISVVVEVDDNERYLIALSDLGLHAIDLLFLVHSDPQNEHLEFAHLVKYQLRQVLNLGSKHALKVDFSQKIEGEKYTTIAEIQLKIAQLKELIVEAIPIADDELSLPVDKTDTDNPGNQDLNELSKRLLGVENRLITLQENIQSFLKSNTKEMANSNDYALGRAYLLEAFWFGMPGALAELQLDQSAAMSELILKKLSVAQKFLTNKIGAIKQQKTLLASEKSTRGKVRKWIDMAKQLFGNAFLVLPHFSRSKPATLDEQLKSNGTQKLLLGSPQQFPMDEWLQGIGEVRKKMAALDTLKVTVEADDLDFLKLNVTQLPYTEGDYWMGMEYPESYQPSGDKQSMVMLNTEALTKSTGATCGMILDQWVEIIPHKKEITGITFNYDQPDATPAHSMLLAVTPNRSGNWEWDDLLVTLQDTLEMAKNRAVEPDQLEKTDLGQLLPALNSEVVPPISTFSEYENFVGTHLVPMDYTDNAVNDEE